MVRAWARGPGSPLGSSSWGGGAGGEGPAPGGAAASGSGGGAAGSAPLRRLEPPTRAPASSRGSSSSSRGHRCCRARHRRPWPQAGSGLGGAGGPLGSAVYAAAAGRGSGAALGTGSPDGRPVTSVAGGERPAGSQRGGSLLSAGMRIDLGSLGWSGRVLPPAAAEAGGGGEGRGERRGRREERTAVAGRRACAPRSPAGCEACLWAVLQDDAPASRTEERTRPGFSALGLGFHRGGREEPWELGGMGKREPLLRQPQPPRRWDPVTRVPPPRRDLSLATPPRLGQFHLSQELKALLFCWP